MTKHAPLRPEIELSWRRSALSGLRADSAPAIDHADVDVSRPIARAARTVLARTMDELDGSRTGVLVADHAARVLDARCTDRSLAGAFAGVGAAVGVGFGEDTAGTNGVGTPLELRRGLAICGPEHFNAVFKGLSCFGYPIINPLTRRIEGVLDISSRRGEEHPLFATVARRVVRDIEDLLVARSPRSHQRLMAAFDTRSRRFGPGRPVAVVALSDGLTVATQAALDQLSQADHVLLRAFADEMRPGAPREQWATLTSGRTVRLHGMVPDGARGAIVELWTDEGEVEDTPLRTEHWPVLVVGEPGTGRTTRARALLGPRRVELDAADAVIQGEPRWWADVTRELNRGPLLVENAHLLSERLTVLLARAMREVRQPTALTVTPEGVQERAELVAVCADRVDLAPLRHRRYEIPVLAQEMLASTSQARLTPATLRVLAAQPWAGNLRELRRIVDGLAAVRTTGDVGPGDLPPSHRRCGGPERPRERAEGDAIAAAVRAAGGNKVKAAKALGVSRSTLYNRIRVLKLDV